MITQARWQELLDADRFVTMPASRAEWERLQAFRPVMLPVALAIGLAFGSVVRVPAAH